jgi:hypothetical protein
MELVQQRTTITSAVYCETLKKNCLGPFRKKRRGMLTYGIVLLHDNAHHHTTARTRALLKHFNWELFDNPLTALISFRATITCLPT